MLQGDLQAQPAARVLKISCLVFLSALSVLSAPPACFHLDNVHTFCSCERLPTYKKVAIAEGGVPGFYLEGSGRLLSLPTLSSTSKYQLRRSRDLHHHHLLPLPQPRLLSPFILLIMATATKTRTNGAAPKGKQSKPAPAVARSPSASGTATPSVAPSVIEEVTGKDGVVGPIRKPDQAAYKKEQEDLKTKIEALQKQMVRSSRMKNRSNAEIVLLYSLRYRIKSTLAQTRDLRPSGGHSSERSGTRSARTRANSKTRAVKSWHSSKR